MKSEKKKAASGGGTQKGGREKITTSIIEGKKGRVKMAIYQMPDHTAWIQRTGYPEGAKELPLCAACGQEIGWDERVYNMDCGWVCEDCFIEDLKELGPMEIALALGVETDIAADVAVYQ